MKWIILAIMLGLLALSHSARAVSSEEMLALEQILAWYPALSNVNPYDQYAYLNQEDRDWGGSWTKPMSEVCSGGNGWDIHGVECRNGHIVSIRFTDSFGHSSGGLLDLSGLTHLESFTMVASLSGGVAPSSMNAKEFTTSVLEQRAVKRLALKWGAAPDFPLSAIEAANLTHVIISKLAEDGNLPRFSDMHYLETVDIDFSIPLAELSNSASTLRSLTIRAVTADPSPLSTFNALEYLELIGPSSSSPGWSMWNLPITLTTLNVKSWGDSTLNIGNPEYSQLEALTVGVSPLLTDVRQLPFALKNLTFYNSDNILSWAAFATPCRLQYADFRTMASAPFPQFGVCPDLRQLSIEQPTETSLSGLMSQDISQLSELKTFEVVDIGNWPSATAKASAQAFLCSLPRELKRLSLSNTNFVDLPTCLADFKELESLNLDQIPFPAGPLYIADISPSLLELYVSTTAIGIQAIDSPSSYWDQIVQRFSNLKTLQVTPLSAQSERPSPPFPAAQIQSLSKLEQLRVNRVGFTGTLPANFFESLPFLKVLQMAGSSMTGSIPANGWANLELVNFQGTLFTDFPSIASPGAPNLREIELSGSSLHTLPDAQSFLLMPKLRRLSIYSMRQLQVPLPTFWTSGAHKLRELIAHGSNFQGSLPATMSSPYLRLLYIHNNKLCGQLPSLTGPMALIALYLNGNHFVGSVPYSWGSQLTITASLNFGSNLIIGSLPPTLLNPYSNNFVTVIFMSDTYIGGNMPNMSAYTALTQFVARGDTVNLGWCNADPDWSSSMGPGSCLISPDHSICPCIDYWQPCVSWNMTEFCSGVHQERPIRPAPGYECNPFSCPLPSPGSAFTCVGSTWISTVSVSQPSITIGTGTTIEIDGNLTITDGITFNGLGSQVFVNGCIFLGDGSEVLVELTTEEVEQLTKDGTVSITLLTASGSCSGGSDLTGTKVGVKGDPKSCRKVKASNSGSTPSMLVVTFTVDSRSCNTKWIILGSVLGGVIVLAAVIVALLVTFNSKVRSAVKPFSKQQPNK